MSRFTSLYNQMAGHLVRTFGDDEIIYVPRIGAPYSISVANGAGGIFEATTQLVDPDTGALTISNQPNVYFKLADLQAEPQNGDRITARGVTYRIVEPMFDGQGGVTLRLNK